MSPSLKRILFWLSCVGVILAAIMPTEYLAVVLVFNWWDKAQHAVAFAWLGFLGLWAYPGRAFAVLIGLLSYGASIEVIQAATGWRYSELADWLADGVGLVLGWLVIAGMRRAHLLR
ncbi:MAG: VanZ family protein [Magnetococcales bacterium]|nr:VanZ family protein [Magnetococcales bacterium]